MLCRFVRNKDFTNPCRDTLTIGIQETNNITKGPLVSQPGPCGGVNIQTNVGWWSLRFWKGYNASHHRYFTDLIFFLGVYFYQHENPIWQVMLQTHNKVGTPTTPTWEKKYIKKVEDITTNHLVVETLA